MSAIRQLADGVLSSLDLVSPQIAAPTKRPGRGPSGRRAPRTPAYDKPATKFASTAAQVNAALASCSGGEVIELTEPLTTALTVTPVAGAAAWPSNVLIRPPLGQRFPTAGGVSLQCPSVTFAGHDFGALQLTVRNLDNLGHGTNSGFWRCVGTTGFMALTGVQDGFLSECVGLRPITTGGDRCDLYGYEAASLVRPLLDGCWFESVTRPVGGSDHSDTVQLDGVSGSKIVDAVLRDCVIMGASNAAVQASDLLGSFTVDNCYLGRGVTDSNGEVVSAPHSLNVGDYPATGFVLLIRHSDTASRFYSDRAPERFYDNRGPSVTNSGAFAGNVSNRPGTVPNAERNPLPDLAAVWPQCPYTGPVS